MGKTTAKESILLSGARLIHEKGYNNTGLKEILDAAGIPKGSFYFHFRSKEDFGLQVVDTYASFIRRVAMKYLGDTSLPPLSRIEGFLDFYIEHFKRMDLRYGCPIGKLMQEMSDLSEPFREKIGSVYDEVCSLIRQCLEDARQAGVLRENLDTRETAQFIFDSWEGAIMHMKLARSAEPLLNCKKMLLSTWADLEGKGCPREPAAWLPG